MTIGKLAVLAVFLIILIALTTVGCARADTLVPPVQRMEPTAVLRVTPADVPDSGAWGPIHKQCPAEGCVIELGPGAYSVLRTWKRPGLLVLRAADPTDRPQVTGGAGCGGHKTEWSGVVIENIDFLPGSGEVTSLPFCDFIRLDGVTIDGKKNNGVHLSNSDRTRVEIVDTTIIRSGQGNTKHNVYIGRVPSALIVNLTSHSSKGSHAFKAIARDIELRDSWLGTVAPGQSVEDAGPYVSTTLADLIACGRSLIENVTLDHVQTDKTGNQVLAYRNRNSILGCDEPPYGTVGLWDTRTRGPAPAGYEGPLEPVGDNDNLRDRYWASIGRAAPYWTPGFWAAPEPAEFTHRLVNVRFIERGQPGRANAITVEGTGPVVVSRTFGPALRLPKPDGWVERTRLDVGAGVTFQGEFRARVVAAEGVGGD